LSEIVKGFYKSRTQGVCVPSLMHNWRLIYLLRGTQKLVWRLHLQWYPNRQLIIMFSSANSWSEDIFSGPRGCLAITYQWVQPVTFITGSTRQGKW